jgi:hypothetical protein
MARPQVADFQVDGSVKKVHDRLLTDVTPAMTRMGFSPAAQTDQTMTYTRRYRPTWAIILAIIGALIFLLGLLFLLVKDTETVLVSLTSEGSKTRVTVTGAREPYVANVIAKYLGQGEPDS